eukprot:1191612-Prorocentrum_minimum.AAC.3
MASTSDAARPMLPGGLRVTFLGSDRNNVGDVNGGDYARQRSQRRALGELIGRSYLPMSRTSAH